MEDLTVSLISMVGTIISASFAAYASIRSSSINYSRAAVTGASDKVARSIIKLGGMIIALSVVVGVIVYALVTGIRPEEEVKPLLVPAGFDSVSWEAGQMAFAIPPSWRPESGPILSIFRTPRGTNFVALVQPVPKDALADLAENPKEAVDVMKDTFKAQFPGTEIIGAPVLKPHQGLPGFTVASRTRVGTTSIDTGMYFIIDRPRERLLVFFYAATEESERVLSTLNVKVGAEESSAPNVIRR